MKQAAIALVALVLIGGAWLAWSGRQERVAPEVARATEAQPFVSETPLDASGAFVVDAFPSTYRLTLSCKRDGRTVQLPARESVTVTPDAAVEQVFTVAIGSARIRVLGSDGKPVAGVKLIAANPEDTWGTTAPATDAEGWTAVDSPPGFIAFTTTRKDLVDGKAWDAFWTEHANDPNAAALARVAVGRVETKVGSTVEVEITLPAASGY